jgi:hypothetical protein
LVVEPEQIGIKPHMANDVIRHYGIHGGEVARLSNPPAGFRTEQGSVDANCKMLTCHDVSNPA